MQQWQVTQGNTVEVVNGERSLDAVNAFYALHPNAGKHVYAKPMSGTMIRLGDMHATMDMVLAQAAAPKRTTVANPVAVDIVATVPDHVKQVAAVKASRPAKVARPAKAPATKTAPVVRPEAQSAVITAAAPVAPVVLVPSANVVAAAPRKGGVIGALLTLLGDGNRRTRAELYDALVAEFPDRASAEGGMRVTIGVQLGALVKKGHKIVSDGDGKGRKYYLA